MYNMCFQWHTFWHQIKVSSKLDLTSEAAQIQVPTLLAWGRYDFTCPLAAGRRYAKLICNAKLHVSSASHNWLIMRPDELRSVLSKFVRSSADASDTGHTS